MSAILYEYDNRTYVNEDEVEVTLLGPNRLSITFMLGWQLFEFLNNYTSSSDEWENFWDSLGRRYPEGRDGLIANVSQAFSWQDTPQGHSYWQSYDRRFSRFDHEEHRFGHKYTGFKDIIAITPETYEVL